MAETSPICGLGLGSSTLLGDGVLDNGSHSLIKASFMISSPGPVFLGTK
jgi:hypothetical protein